MEDTHSCSSVICDISQAHPTERWWDSLLCRPRGWGTGDLMDELDHQCPGFVLFTVERAGQEVGVGTQPLLSDSAPAP